ncbi:MAG: hypothetical protein PUD79_04780 [Prevotellaceae bacterium]|nr:hypothetical protein [Prevotellaceae bacterium]
MPLPFPFSILRLNTGKKDNTDEPFKINHFNCDDIIKPSQIIRLCTASPKISTGDNTTPTKQ